MFNLLSRWSLSILLVSCVSCDIETKETAQNKIRVDTLVVLSDTRISLIKEYCQIHYGINDYVIDTPRSIVIHYTAIPSLEETLALFQKDSITKNRSYISQFSALNVGIHYVVDKTGEIYSLLPDTVVARHCIGFNHLSIGIENVARNAEELTDSQLNSNVKLIKHLKSKYSTIEYLFGHDESYDRSLEHFEMFKSLNPQYKPYPKPDPGPEFMIELRQRLYTEYELEFAK